MKWKKTNSNTTVSAAQNSPSKNSLALGGNRHHGTAQPDHQAKQQNGGDGRNLMGRQCVNMRAINVARTAPLATAFGNMTGSEIFPEG